jgi:hypothetical protein
MLRAGLTMKVLAPREEPTSRVCKTGHIAPDTFVNASGEEAPNRFLRISGPELERTHHGIYCEACVTKANRMAKKIRAEKEG